MVKADINEIVNCKYMPWRKKYRYGILSDIALILVNKEKVEKAYLEIASFIQKNQQNSIAEFYTILNEVQSDITRFLWSENLISQVKSNWNFYDLVEKRVIVSATMSAGKSTLINAIIGKKSPKHRKKYVQVIHAIFIINHLRIIRHICVMKNVFMMLQKVNWRIFLGRMIVRLLHILGL